MNICLYYIYKFKRYSKSYTSFTGVYLIEFRICKINSLQYFYSLQILDKIRPRDFESTLVSS